MIKKRLKTLTEKKELDTSEAAELVALLELLAWSEK